MSFIEFKNVYKRYKNGEVVINASDGVNFAIEEGEFAVIVGTSGAGKTTVLNMLGGIDRATEGEIIVDGEDIVKYDEKKLITYRRNNVGFVFQFYNLMNNLTVKENVELSTHIRKNGVNPIDVLEKVGMDSYADMFPSQLSGGQQQRVAIARALAKNPKLLLCDEPTGALDYETAKSVLKLLKELSEKMGMTVIVITHNLAITPMADRIIRMKSSKVESITVNETVVPIDDIEW
ncbi:MAG: ABC transporter ATP-binding protein [Anaerofustis stercorihominis]|nr:ABC transporter ATP-binding protein [Anaerofustis stercorihominis]